MSAQQEIKNAQAKWASCKGIAFDLRSNGGYVRDIKDNLRGCLSARASEGYRTGAGRELEGHMKALHSSSALVVNFFDYWTDKDKAPLLCAMGITAGEAKSFDFEKTFPTGLGGTPPHLDVAMTLSDGYVTAVEGKFIEWASKRTRVDADFREKYLRSSPGLWKQQSLFCSQELAEEIGPGKDGGKSLFQFLGAEQLLKHSLGLATQLGKGNFSLYYLYYDWSGESDEARKRSRAHKDEIDLFSDRVGDELCFKALTYQEVYKRLRESEQAEPEYLEYLVERYFAGKGAPKP